MKCTPRRRKLLRRSDWFGRTGHTALNDVAVQYGRTNQIRKIQLVESKNIVPQLSLYTNYNTV